MYRIARFRPWLAAVVAVPLVALAAQDAPPPSKHQAAASETRAVEPHAKPGSGINVEPTIQGVPAPGTPIAIQLRFGHAQHVAGGTAVTGHALRTAGKVPGRVCQLRVRSFLGHQRGVGLLVVPAVRVAGPFTLLAKEYSCLNATA